MLSILTVIYVALSLLAIVSGTAVMFGLLNGRLLGKWAVIFLKCSLIASAIGLFSLFRRLQGLTLTQTALMLSVYMAGVSILAWRKYHFVGVWCSVFAVTTTMVLYLISFAFLSRIFDYLSSSGIQAFSRPWTASIATQFVFMAFFIALGLFAARRFHDGHPRSF